MLDAGLLLGRSSDAACSPIGFCPASAINNVLGDPIRYHGDGHLITIASTGAGKTSGPVVCNARTYPGQLIVLDVKGEAYRLSASHRRRMGQKVHVIDLNDRSPHKDALNPLDIAKMLGDDLITISRSMAAEMIDRPETMTRDFFWIDWAETMLTAGISYLLHHRPDACQISRLFDTYATGDDIDYRLAVKLDTTKPMNRATEAGWAGYLRLPDKETRPCVLGSTTAYLRLFEGEMARRLTDTTTIDLRALVRGDPMTLFIIVPPHRIKAYAPLLRLWLASLMNLLTLRETIPASPTLMMVDETAQLGRMDSFVTASTLMRGYGLRLWSFWQSASQLEIYGSAAKTIVDNAGVVQVFGIRNYRAAAEVAALIGGVTPDAVMAMRHDEQLLMVDGGAPRVSRQVRYYSDPLFKTMELAR